uniref:Sortilin-related receptor, L(DLR class) A repeats containing n=1 Tax=Salmo trutta TaxID=8032 RepID=A0A674CL20_SALTR
MVQGRLSEIKATVIYQILRLFFCLQANLNDSHNQMVVHWAGEKSNVIVALARDSVGATGPKTSSVYVSYDYGTSFSPISERFQLSGEKEKEGNKQVISQFYHSPADNKRYLFADSTNSYLWNSFDFCKTIQGFSIPFKPTDLLLHSKRANLVLGYDSSHPNKQLWKSDDFGETWVLIQEHVKAYFWGVEPYDSPTTVLVQRHEPQGVSSILSSTDFFQSGQNRRVILERVDNFQLRDKYMFATTSTTLLGSHEPSSVQLWVSYNRQPMKAAQFMTRHPITEYYIADASEDQVFVCVNHVNNVTHLYISDTQGLSFSLSLENVLYYSPEGSGSHTLIRYFASEPFADLHRVEGLRGVFVATLINGSLSEDNMRSVITFDKGGTWELLQAPSADMIVVSIDLTLLSLTPSLPPQRLSIPPSNPPLSSLILPLSIALLYPPGISLSPILSLYPLPLSPILSLYPLPLSPILSLYPLPLSPILSLHPPILSLHPPSSPSIPIPSLYPPSPPSIPHPLPLSPILSLYPPSSPSIPPSSPSIPHPLPLSPSSPSIPHPLPLSPILSLYPPHPLPLSPHPLPLSPILSLYPPILSLYPPILSLYPPILSLHPPSSPSIPPSSPSIPPSSPSIPHPLPLSPILSLYPSPSIPLSLSLYPSIPLPLSLYPSPSIPLPLILSLYPPILSLYPSPSIPPPPSPILSLYPPSSPSIPHPLPLSPSSPSIPYPLPLFPSSPSLSILSLSFHPLPLFPSSPSLSILSLSPPSSPSIPHPLPLYPILSLYPPSSPSIPHPLPLSPHPLPLSPHPLPLSPILSLYPPSSPSIPHPLPLSPILSLHPPILSLHPHPLPLSPILSLYPPSSPSILHPLPLSPHPLPLSPHPLPLSPHPLPPSPHPLPLSPHPLPLSPHPLPLSPHPLPLSPILSLYPPSSPSIPLPLSLSLYPLSSPSIPLPLSLYPSPSIPYPLPLSPHPLPLSLSLYPSPPSPHPLPLSPILSSIPHPLPLSPILSLSFHPLPLSPSSPSLSILSLSFHPLPLFPSSPSLSILSLSFHPLPLFPSSPSLPHPLPLSPSSPSIPYPLPLFPSSPSLSILSLSFHPLPLSPILSLYPPSSPSIPHPLPLSLSLYPHPLPLSLILSLYPLSSPSIPYPLPLSPILSLYPPSSPSIPHPLPLSLILSLSFHPLPLFPSSPSLSILSLSFHPLPYIPHPLPPSPILSLHPPSSPPSPHPLPLSPILSLIPHPLPYPPSSPLSPILSLYPPILSLYPPILSLYPPSSPSIPLPLSPILSLYPSPSIPYPLPLSPILSLYPPSSPSIPHPLPLSPILSLYPPSSPSIPYPLPYPHPLPYPPSSPLSPILSFHPPHPLPPSPHPLPLSPHPLPLSPILSLIPHPLPLSPILSLYPPSSPSIPHPLPYPPSSPSIPPCYVYLNLFLSLVFLGGVTPHTPAPGPSSCAPNRFRCGSGACIVNSWVCDGYADCPDGSDELGCPTANSTATQAPWPTHAPPLPPGRCSKGQFLCRKPPTCIPDWQRCDGHQHCLDGSDEAHCPTRGPLTCVNGTRCADGEACLLDGEKCDGFMDCSDHSDEDNCTSDSLVYKIQNLRWTADFSGAITLTWSRPKNLPLASCYFLIYYRLVGTQQWTSMDTHSNKSSYTLSVLKPDTTYQVKVLTQCLSKQHKTNDVLTLRTPEGLPDPPRNLQLSCDNGEDGTVEASWSVPDKAHGLIREYIVEYSEKGVEWFSQRSTGNGVEVKNLLPSTLYKFRVAAVTGRGMGNWTEVKSIIPKKGMTESLMIIVRQYVVVLSWVFDAHVKESRNYTVRGSILKAANLTTGTIYEVAVWAQTGVGDSPTALSRQQTKGTQPEPPLLKARALNQSSVDCSWTVTGSPVYGIFFATSFLDLYRSPHSVNTSSSSRTVAVDSDEQYLFLVRAISPYLGPPSEYAVVKMIPNERLPPRNLHKVRVEKTQAMLKWQPPYDSPSAPLTYAVHLKDVVRKTESSYKLTTQNNTVEYCLKGLEPGGHYSVSVRLRNMSKEASYTLNTMPLPAPEALKILTEKDHVFLFWKSLAVKERSFNESRGYEVHVYDSLSNSTVLLGNTTETFFRISSLLAGHNYTFSVQARCLLNGQLCGKSALLLYDQLGQVRSSGQSGDMAVVVVPVLFLLLLGLCGGLVVLYLRHRRLQNNFTAFANSHYNSRLGSAIFSSGDELGDDDEDAPMISGFSDDVPMVIA